MSKNNPGDNNGTTDGIIKIQQPNKLHGLHQALFIMKCLSEGQYLDQIIDKFEGDEQLVKLWISYLIHNKRIQNPIDHKWIVTEKGKRWMEKYERGGRSTTAAATNQKGSEI